MGYNHSAEVKRLQRAADIKRDAGSDPRERSTPDTVSATVTVSPPRLTGYEDR